MNQPNFSIEGVPKRGTVSLHIYLSKHPLVFLPEPKEPHFFRSGFPRSRVADKYRLRTALWNSSETPKTPRQTGDGCRGSLGMHPNTNIRVSFLSATRLSEFWAKDLSHWTA